MISRNRRRFLDTDTKASTWSYFCQWLWRRVFNHKQRYHHHGRRIGRRLAGPFAQEHPRHRNIAMGFCRRQRRCRKDNNELLLGCTTRQVPQKGNCGACCSDVLTNKPATLLLKRCFWSQQTPHTIWATPFVKKLAVNRLPFTVMIIWAPWKLTLATWKMRTTS